MLLSALSPVWESLMVRRVYLHPTSSPRKDVYVPFRLPHQFFLLISFPRTPQEGIFSLIGSVWSDRVVTPSIPPRFDSIRFEASISAASGMLKWAGRQGRPEGGKRKGFGSSALGSDERYILGRREYTYTCLHKSYI
jgi:hypothetical protein